MSDLKHEIKKMFPCCKECEEIINRDSTDVIYENNEYFCNNICFQRDEARRDEQEHCIQVLDSICKHKIEDLELFEKESGNSTLNSRNFYELISRMFKDKLRVVEGEKE